MKKLLTTIFLVLTVLIFESCASIATKTVESKPVTKIIKIENADKNKLYVRANNWMVSAFNNAESVIQFSDKESGTVTGKYFLGKAQYATQYVPEKNVYAIINIQVKDGASKITITPDSWKHVVGGWYSKPAYTAEKAEADVNALISNFEAEMLREVSDDW